MPHGRGRKQSGAPHRAGQPIRARAADPGAADRRALVALRERLTAVIEPVTGQAGFDLERVGVARIGRRHSVQVVVDRDEGVGLDAIAEVSHAVSQALDAADESGTAVMPGEYVLEVSSPGVDRPLTEPRHWRRNVGRLVAVSLPGGGSGTGRIIDTTADHVVLEVDGGRREVPYGQLGRGRIQVELRRAGEDLDGDDSDEGGRSGEDEREG